MRCLVQESRTFLSRNWRLSSAKTQIWLGLCGALSVSEYLLIRSVKKCPGRNLGMLRFEPDGVGKLLEVFNSIMRGSGFVFGALKTEMQ